MGLRLSLDVSNQYRLLYILLNRFSKTLKKSSANISYSKISHKNKNSANVTLFKFAESFQLLY
jgi:hypothetical protein